MDKSNHNDARQLWAECETWREENTPYIENMLRLDRAMKEADKTHDELIETSKKEAAELRAKCEELRPDYESIDLRLRSALTMTTEEWEALGSFADVFRSEMETLLKKNCKEREDWDKDME
jgi:DNA repair exonuclease SbcCD ATPase subunit